MIMPIPFLNEIVNLSYYVIDLYDFLKGTSEVDLVTRRGRYERTPPVEVDELIFLKEDETYQYGDYSLPLKHTIRIY